MELTHTAAREGRLSSFLLGELKMSTGLMNKLKWGDAIQVNGQSRWTNHQVLPGDIITVRLEEEAPLYPPEDGPLEILYEDDHLLVVDKPAGMLIHPSRSRNDGTLANLVYGYYRRTGQQSAFHPMTRLDRDTYGIVLLAKNSYVHALLQTVEVKKTYHALTLGWGPEDRGIIDAPIARRPLPSLLREISPEGKPSVTEYRVMERSLSLRTSPPQRRAKSRPTGGCALHAACGPCGVAIPLTEAEVCKLSLSPITGRTHQLRLHCAHMGHPILGDPQYGNEESLALSEKLGITSQILCAKRLEFAHPVTGEAMMLESKMDAEI